MSVGFVFATINFEEGDCLMTIDFITGRMYQSTFCLRRREISIRRERYGSITRCRFNASTSLQYFKQNSQM